MANYHAARLAFKKPLTFFGIIFSFLIPPLGFLLNLLGLIRDKRNNEKYGGWIFLMIISIVISVFLVIYLI